MQQALQQAAVRRLVCGLACALAAGAAGAQSMDRINQRAWGQIGAFHPNVDSLIRIDYLGDAALGLPAAGTTLDFERNLGLASRKTLPNVSLGLRIFERWRVEFETYSLSRSATQNVLDEDVVIGGTTYSASADLRSSFDTRVQRLSLGYSLMKSPTAEFGVALGVQYTRYRLGFVGTGRINGQAPSTSSVEERDSGPLPTVGLFGTTALGGPWSLAARVDYLPVDSKRVEGYLGNVEANLYYALSPHWSLGVGYKTVSYKVVRKSNGDFGARFQYKLAGPQVMLEAGF